MRRKIAGLCTSQFLHDYVGGILCGADKLFRAAWLQSDPALSQVLGVEAIASQSSLSRFFDVFGQKTCKASNDLHRRAMDSLPSLKEGCLLDLDSWALLHGVW
ncbi:MAG: transposase [Verrucomicrobiia bacterium]